MAGVKESPRQRMISMMYLVLTALLALNVSKDVINAFLVVNDNIVQTNENLSQKLNEIYANFEKNYQINQVKVKPYWEKAQEAKVLSGEMVDYVENVRNELIAATENVSIDSAKRISVKNIKKKDNYLVPTRYFMGSSNDGSDGASKKLKDRIILFRQEMLALVDSRNLRNVNLGLDTEGPYYNADGLEQNWETHFFYNTIVAADIPILNKIISDVYNAEYDVVNLLHKSIGQGDFKFDRIEAKVLPKSNFVCIGDEYQAEIIVAAYDTTQSPEVYFMQGVDYLPATMIGQATLLDNVPGKINLNLSARMEGLNKYAGFVRAKASTGEVNDYHFNNEYYVASASFTISAKKMNVFYIGVDNPVSIDISGIPKESLTPAISCGTIKPDLSSNDWVVNVPVGCNDAVVTLATNINGVQKYLGSKTFRVKKLPDPAATIGGKNSGVINRDIMIAAGALAPKMPDDFEFDHSFVISSFTMTVQRGFKVYNLDSKNAYLTTEMIDQIKQTNRGQSVVFENIMARDPDGIERTLSPIVLTIN